MGSVPEEDRAFFVPKRQGRKRERVRIPFPIHIPLSWAGGFALILFAIQLLQGTAPIFAICALLFIVLSAVTFNVAGGFSRPSGAYVFSYSVLVVIVGLCWKAVLGERADSNLEQPNLMMEIYLGSIVAMLVSVIISRKLTLKRPLLGNLVNDSNMQNATAGCLMAAILVEAILLFTARQSGSLLSAVAQLNHFPQMAVILAAIYEIRVSGGKRSINLAVVVASAITFLQGILGFSKAAIFMPTICWLVAVGSQGYRISRMQIVTLGLWLFFLMHYMVPYCQYGKGFNTGSFTGQFQLAVGMLEDLPNVRAKYLVSNSDYYENKTNQYFNKPQGFMDRLQMIAPDNSLVDITEKRGPIGPFPIIMDFENLVPRVLWPDKPAVNFGNMYAHELGGLSEDDDSTGVSFSPSGEAYHVAGWFGIFFWAPLLWVMLFTLFDSLCGDTRLAPWGLLMVAYFSHIAPEGMLGGMIYAMGYVAFGLVVVAVSAAYVMPILGSLIKGPEPVRLRKTALVGAVAGRGRAAPSQGVGQ